jgi:hypothetical protein
MQRSKAILLQIFSDGRVKEALHGNRSGTASLVLIVLAVLTVFGSWAMATVRHADPSFMKGVLLNAVIPLAVLGIVLAITGLQKDRTIVPASISLVLVPAAMAAAWLVGLFSGAF